MPASAPLSDNSMESETPFSDIADELLENDKPKTPEPLVPKEIAPTLNIPVLELKPIDSDTSIVTESEVLRPNEGSRLNILPIRELQRPSDDAASKSLENSAPSSEVAFPKIDAPITEIKDRDSQVEQRKLFLRL